VGQLITDVIDIPELIGYTREATNAEMDGLLARLLPTIDVDDLEYELQNIEVPTYEVARFRAWDTAPPFGRRPGFVTIRGEILPLGLRMKLNEKEIVRFNAFRAGLGGTLQDVYDDALQTARACAWRIQRARADLLNDGKVTITENGLVGLEADFGVPGGHIVTAATAWTDTTNSTPVTNLKAWQATYRAANAGRNPAAWLVSSDVVADLTLNAQIRNLTPITGVVPGIITGATVGQVFAASGIAPLVVFDGEAPNPTTGLMERLLSARKVIAVPGVNLGNVLSGVHPMSTNLMGRGILRRNQLPGVVTWVEEETTPASITTISESVALPILRDPKALFVATV
jgi:hypothetical protein